MQGKKEKLEIQTRRKHPHVTIPTAGQLPWEVQEEGVGQLTEPGPSKGSTSLAIRRQRDLRGEADSVDTGQACQLEYMTF